MRTVIFSFAISDFICVMVIASLWYQNRRQFAGTGFWLADYVLQYGAVLLIALQRTAPNILFMTLSSAMIIGGTVLLYIGLERFVGKPGSQIRNYLLISVFVFADIYMAFAVHNLAGRTILFSFGLLVICAQSAWLLLRRVDRVMLSITSEVGLVFVLICLVSFLRIIFDLATPPQSDIFHSDLYDTLSILTYQMLFIILTFNLFLMVNRRLVFELSQDIHDRQRAEQAHRLSEEKFYKAFHSSPDTIVITRISDGQIVEVNGGFSRTFGYTREEALASSTIKLGIWVNLQDRERVITTLREQNSVRDWELEFRTKSGRIINSLYSSEIIYLNDEAHFLSVVRDISEQKRTERLIHLRLELWEFASTHPLEKLMQKALDEIGDLTDSPIGFYHIVEEDQNTLTLKAWSTRTLAEFCEIEGENMHYPIREAGVWVDCVYQRKPVIHNDYDSLPHRKGMPGGHARVVRELVVPTMRDGRVVSILGVGNKPTDYDEHDVDLVAYIADVIWTIVEQKHANEQIHLLNTRLEQMAMTDDMTGLDNRRSFFKRGREEIKRAQRYQTSLSLLMLDIDHFKQVNDTYGHDFGDLTLQCVAHALKSNLREVDILARLGGEEFAILLPNTNASEAILLGERIRTTVEQAICSSQHLNFSVTVSIGVSTYSQDTLNLDAMLLLADRAMYEAKSQGRNRVVYQG